jgi:formylglycine-generating enzyme required for sulfatase activity
MMPLPTGSSVHSVADSNEAKAGDRMELEIASGVKMAFRWCPPGTFLMGSPESEAGRYYDEVQHQVTLSKGFWLGETVVTQAQWKSVMGNNPSLFKGSDCLPVETVSWNEAKEFLRKAKVPAGMVLRLPSEAEWEYACRAGTTGAIAGKLEQMAWYDANAGGETRIVGAKEPNGWGLRDMHGNVWEWCEDWYSVKPRTGGLLGGLFGTSTSRTMVDPVGPGKGLLRVFRGGSWSCSASVCRSAKRSAVKPDFRDNDLGFRPVLVPST